MMSLFRRAQKRVYLDNAGATEIGEHAKRALLESLSVFGNPSGIHHEGASAGQLLDKARTLCATALNAHAYEIYFTGSGTESCNLAILGVYKGATHIPVPHIITSSIEHPSVLEPIKQLEKAGKITVTYLPVYDDGIVKVKDIREALSPETILVSVMYANNEIGTIQPVKEIGRMLDEWKKEKELSHTSYPYFHTDACQAANYCNLDVVRLRAHLVTVNSSKVYGPKGIALLYKREGITLEPVVYGGGQERQLRSGTENVAGAYAFGIALKEALELRESESLRLRRLRDETVKHLKKEIPSIMFYGAFDQYHPSLISDSDHATGLRLPAHDITGKTRFLVYNPKTELRLPNNINCRVPGISSEEMILRLDAKGFAVSHKSACASMETDGSYVVQALGASTQEALENIRISMGRKTTKDDMESLVKAMKDIQGKYGR